MICADTHTHSIACDHAFSTIDDNACAASKKGLSFLAITEHAPTIPGAPSMLYFASLSMIPDVLHGVSIIKGAEVNIINHDGGLDIPDKMLDGLDWVIASMHIPCYTPTTTENHTNTWLKVAENPLVDVIGHCGDGRYPFDYDIVLPAFAKHNKIVEINSHSFNTRAGSTENCRKIAQLCEKYGVNIVLSSDAHHASQIGNFAPALKMLEEINFPEQLILNADYDRFLAVVNDKKLSK